jgi:hypothetical protein
VEGGADDGGNDAVATGGGAGADSCRGGRSTACSTCFAFGFGLGGCGAGNATAGCGTGLGASFGISGSGNGSGWAWGSSGDGCVCGSVGGGATGVGDTGAESGARSIITAAGGAPGGSTRTCRSMMTSISPACRARTSNRRLVHLKISAESGRSNPSAATVIGSRPRRDQPARPSNIRRRAACS